MKIDFGTSKEIAISAVAGDSVVFRCEPRKFEHGSNFVTGLSHVDDYEILSRVDG